MAFGCQWQQRLRLLASTVRVQHPSVRKPRREKTTARGDQSVQQSPACASSHDYDFDCDCENERKNDDYDDDDDFDYDDDVSDDVSEKMKSD